MALAYLLGKPSAKILKVNLNIPLILVLSIIPDIDILAGDLLNTDIHRGPTHSLIASVLVFIPIFVLYRQKAVPYFVALISHSLIGDFFIGGRLQLLWPLSTGRFGLHELGSYYISIYSPLNVVLESTLFVIATVILFKTRDILQFFTQKKSNLILTIPIVTVLLPTFASFPLQVPILLIPPHLFYLVLFSVSVLIVILRIFKRQKSINKSLP